MVGEDSLALARVMKKISQLPLRPRMKCAMITISDENFFVRMNNCNQVCWNESFRSSEAELLKI